MTPSQDDDFSLSTKSLDRRNYVKKGWIVRFCMAIVFIVSLFLFLHYREVRVDLLELNSVSDRYVIAEVDFDFYDEDTTKILRQESLRDIGEIYKIDGEQIRQRRLEFEDFLLHNHSWRQIIEYATFDEMYKGGKELEEALLKMRFTDARTIKKMHEMHIPIVNYEQLNLDKISDNVVLPDYVWTVVEKIAFVDQVIQPGAKAFIVSFFKGKGWNLYEDFVAMRSISNLVQKNVADKFTKVKAGDHLIDPGEKVTPRHVAMFKAMQRALKKSKNLLHPSTWAGSLIISLLFTLIGYGYLRRYFPEIIYSRKKLVLLMSVIILNLALAKLTEYFLFRESQRLIELVRYPIFAAFAAILLCVLLNQRVAVLVCGFLIIIWSLALPVERNGFIVMNLFSVLVVVISAKSLRRRKDVFVVCFRAWLVCVLAVLGLNLYDNTVYSLDMAADVVASLIFMLSTGILVVAFLPLFESVFSILTDVTLVEYMDPNHELLRRLSIEAPGTYQHAIVVGNLAERAALAIGANGLFCRVATMYHDIGKLVTPHYFTENQQGGINMHHLLTPLESAQVIVGHVTEGVSIGRKSRLPERFIDVIKEHHGNTLVYFFYRKQCELVGGDKSLVNEEDFRYPGPCPQSKESAIIMIADSIEAASRSLEELSEQSVTELVDSIVNEKARDGQFDNCQLTFEELGIIKKEIIKTLVAAGHSRIKYPQKEQ